jgi:hypothetical protein
MSSPYNPREGGSVFNSIRMAPIPAENSSQENPPSVEENTPPVVSKTSHNPMAAKARKNGLPAGCGF